jgi:hypothetical protein
MAKSKSLFTGRWRIISMDTWDVDYMEDEGPAFIEFGADQMGEFRFGLTSGNIDYRITERCGQPTAEWTWEGMDEMDPCTGRGWAVFEDDELHGMIFFHQGDESSFVAKKAKTQKRLKKRKGPWQRRSKS